LYAADPGGIGRRKVGQGRFEGSYPGSTGDEPDPEELDPDPDDPDEPDPAE